MLSRVPSKIHADVLFRSSNDFNQFAWSLRGLQFPHNPAPRSAVELILSLKSGTVSPRELPLRIQASASKPASSRFMVKYMMKIILRESLLYSEKYFTLKSSTYRFHMLVEGGACERVG